MRVRLRGVVEHTFILEFTATIGPGPRQTGV